MITGIGATGGRPLDQIRTDSTARKAAPAPVSANESDAGTPVSAAKAMADAGAPIDMDKVAQIKAGIANGTYKVNAQAIADKMIAIDLPTK